MSQYVITQLIYIGRILLAAFCGGIIGYERESKRKIAGLRTHVIVAISSAVMMLLSKYGFHDVLGEYVRLDPSRVAAGIVTAIGFLGTGIIFFRNNNVNGLTTSAGIWATVGVGMSIGAGMYIVGIASTILILFVEIFLGRKGVLAKIRKKAMQETELSIEYILTEQDSILETIQRQFKVYDCRIIHFTLRKKDDSIIKITYFLTTPESSNLHELVNILKENDEIQKISLS